MQGVPSVHACTRFPRSARVSAQDHSSYCKRKREKKKNRGTNWPKTVVANISVCAHTRSTLSAARSNGRTDHSVDRLIFSRSSKYHRDRITALYDNSSDMRLAILQLTHSRAIALTCASRHVCPHNSHVNKVRKMEKREINEGKISQRGIAFESNFRLRSSSPSRLHCSHRRRGSARQTVIH